MKEKITSAAPTIKPIVFPACVSSQANPGFVNPRIKVITPPAMRIKLFVMAFGLLS
jgi:hypothetical protein